MFELPSSRFSSWRQILSQEASLTKRHWRKSPKSMVICSYLNLCELYHLVTLKMNFTIVTFLSLQSPSRVTLDDKNTKHCFFLSCERENHYLLGWFFTFHWEDECKMHRSIWIMCWWWKVGRSLYISHYLCTSFCPPLVHIPLGRCTHRNRKCWYNERHTARGSEHTHWYLNREKQNSHSLLSFKTITKKVLLRLCFSCQLKLSEW